MAISYKYIRTARQWKASTGLSENQFFDLIALLKHGYLSMRAFNSEEEFKSYLAKEPSILIDVTEQL
jgi:hypothetical protein